MQERQKIQLQLERMREECVRDYLQDKLQQITSKEVIHDILQQFLQADNQEFLASIADNIQQAKQQNRTLKAEMEVVRQQGELRLQQATQAIHQQSQQRLKEEVSAASQRFQAEIARLQGRIGSLEEAKVSLEQQREQLRLSLKSQLVDEEQMEALKTQLAESKRSFASFKDSCERIIYEGNREKQREKQRMTDEWARIRQDLEAQIQSQQKGEALFKELQLQERMIQEKEGEVLQLDKRLQQSLSKLEEMKDLYGKLCQQFQESKQRQQHLSDQLCSLNRTLESNELSLNYLREENSYLREEILSFSARYEQLEKEKAVLTRTANQYKQNLSKRTDEHHRMQQAQQEQFTMKMESYKHQYETTITETLQQLSRLKQETESYHQINASQEASLAAATQENSALQQSRLELQEQLNNKISHIERQEQQIHQYQAELINVRRQCCAQIQSLKQTLDANWNCKNEQLIQQQFLSHQLKGEISHLQTTISGLKEEISSLHHDISIRDQKQQYYRMVTAQIKALQKKYTPDKTEEKAKSDAYRFMTREDKVYFILRQMEKEISMLKRGNEELRGFVMKSFGQFSASMQQTTAYNIAKTLPITLKPQQTTHHQVSLKKNVQMKLLIEKEAPLDKKEEVFNRTVQQRVTNQPITPNSASNFSQIRKTLKNIQQRYQSVQQQNKLYSTHLDTYIKQA